MSEFLPMIPRKRRLAARLKASVGMIAFTSALGLAPVSAWAALLSVPFSSGFIGAIGNSTGQADSISTFSTLGISRAYFTQESDSDQFGGTQGNDYSGTLLVVLTDGQLLSIPGAINWRDTSQGGLDAIGFIPDPASTISYTFDGQTVMIDGSRNIGLQAFDSTVAYADNTDVSGNAATSGLLEALNTYLANATEANQQLAYSDPATVPDPGTDPTDPGTTGGGTGSPTDPGTGGVPSDPDPGGAATSTDAQPPARSQSVLERVLATIDSQLNGSVVPLNGIFANIAENNGVIADGGHALLNGIDGHVSNSVDYALLASASTGESIRALGALHVSFGDMSTTTLAAVNTGTITAGASGQIEEALSGMAGAMSASLNGIGTTTDRSTLALNLASGSTSVLGFVTNRISGVNAQIGEISTTTLGAVNNGTISSGLERKIEGIQAAIIGTD